jgi:hypothetical protein
VVCVVVPAERKPAASFVPPAWTSVAYPSGIPAGGAETDPGPCPKGSGVEAQAAGRRTSAGPPRPPGTAPHLALFPQPRREAAHVGPASAGGCRHV